MPNLQLTPYQLELEKKASWDESLIQALVAFPHITPFIRSLWGTEELDRYLNNLFLDTRDGTRTGFPIEAYNAIIRLMVLNRRFIARTSSPAEIADRKILQAWEYQ